jgi:CRP-like cAMP-binding protein
MENEGFGVAPYRNTILNLLPADSIARLQLVPVVLPLEREIEFPGSAIRHVFFPERGVASMTTTFLDGSQVEIALCGSESILGSSYFLGTRRSLNRVYMQIAGYGYSSKIAIAAAEFDRHGEFNRLVLRYTQAQFIQSSQTAGCNARHSLEQRLARWLLLCHDRVEHGTIHLPQEFIAEMLGNRRTSVSVEAGKLQNGGLIQYSRGKIEVLDRPGLERKACECYATVRNDLKNYAESNWEVERSARLRSVLNPGRSPSDLS